MKYYVRKKPCKLKTNYIYHKMYTCFFLNSRPRKSDLIVASILFCKCGTFHLQSYKLTVVFQALNFEISIE